MPSSPSPSPNFIILCDEGSFFTYNLLTHKLYEISEDEVAALRHRSAGNTNPVLDNLGFKPADPHSPWHGHLTSAIAHKGSRIYSHNTETLSPAELARSYTDMSNASTTLPARFCPDGPHIELP